MKKKIVLLGMLLIVVVSLGAWAVKAAFFPSASAPAAARDFLIQYYSIPDHQFYTDHLVVSPPDATQAKKAIDDLYSPFLTESFMDAFQARLEGFRTETWAYDNGCTLSIDKLDVQPTSTGTEGNITFLQYDITLTVTRESDKQLTTVVQTGLINVDKGKDGYRVSAWQKLNENELLYDDLFPQ